jgi:hypothetical protein
VGVANVSSCAQFQEASTQASRAIKQLDVQKQQEMISMQYVILNSTIMYGLIPWEVHLCNDTKPYNHPSTSTAGTKKNEHNEQKCRMATAAETVFLKQLKQLKQQTPEIFDLPASPDTVTGAACPFLTLTTLASSSNFI